MVGGSGLAGKVHVSHLKKFKACVGNSDLVENAECDDNFVGQVPYREPFEKGYKSAIVALPSRLLCDHCTQLIDAGFEKILIENPGGDTSDEIRKLITYAQEKSVAITINYERTFDRRVAQLLNQIK